MDINEALDRIIQLVTERLNEKALAGHDTETDQEAIAYLESWITEQL